MGDNSRCLDGIEHCHKAMVNIFNKIHNGLTVFHFNARSLNGPKLDYFRYTFENSGTDIICVSETWFNSELPDSMYDLQGFQLFRNDRASKRGGGVAIYCRKSLNASLINVSHDSPVEFINVAISGHCNKVCVSCVYNPQRQNVLDPFFSDLAPRLVDFNFYIVCGDFNVDVLRNDACAVALLNHTRSAGLSLINSSLPTRFSNNSTPSLLDLFFISDINNVIKYDQLGFISDHDLTFCSLNISLQRSNVPSTFHYRDYKNINYELLFSDLGLVSWTGCHSYATVDSKLQWFMGIIMEIFDRHIPLRKVVVRSESCPWFTSDVLDAIKTRNKLRSKWKNSSNDVNWKKFVSARNYADKTIKIAKLTYYQSQLHDSFTSKQLWNNLRKLKVVSVTNTECRLQPDLLNTFFTDMPVTGTTPVKCQYSYCEVRCPFKFITVTPEMVESTILGIFSNATGHDGLPIRFIKLCLPFVLSPITHIINHCFTTSTFPKQWKIATVTPVPKKPKPLVPSDYRPISILPGLAKVCERLMAEQIMDYLSRYALLSPMQSGFRKAHSCTTAILKILNDIRQPFDNNFITFLCLLDFSKAFDSVNHELLCNKLANFFHFDQASCKLMASYLSNRLQRVKVCDQFSELTMINAGVPQGSTLGPILFSMFINDIFLCCNKVNMHAFADDVQLYLSGPMSNVDELVKCLNEELGLIHDWANNNMLLLNSSKSKILPIYGRRANFEILPVISMGGNALEVVSVARNLGYFINSGLTASDHIHFVCTKIYGLLRLLRRSSQYTTVSIRYNLAHQLIMPHITYFCLIYSKLDSYSANKLILLFNNVTRYVFNLRKFDHVSAYCKLLLGVGIIDYIKIRNLTFLHGLLLRKTPQYLFDNIQRCQSNRSNQLVIPRYKHLPAERLFFVNAVRSWNLLPITLRVITTVSAFKAAIYDYFANNTSV